MNRYNILWIDDQYDEQSKFMDEAEADGFDVIPFKTSVEGMDYFEKNLHDVDGIILDAKVFKSSTDERASERGLTASRQEIARICAENDTLVPHVVLTGQPDLMDSGEFEERMDVTEVFSKNATNDILFNRLRELVADSFGAQMRNRHSQVYQACNADGLGSASWQKILTILNLVENKGNASKAPYNDFRILLEEVFRQLHQYKILHDAFVGRDVQLNPSSKFLSGQPVAAEKDGPRLTTSEVVLPVIIAKNVDYILTATQPGSHSEDITKTTSSDRSISYLEKYVPQHHLLQLLTHMLLDVISWAHSYITENANPEENKRNWIDLSKGFDCEGVIIRDGNFLNIQATTHTEILRRPMRQPTNSRPPLAVGDKVCCKVKFEKGQPYPTVLSICKI